MKIVDEELYKRRKTLGAYYGELRRIVCSVGTGEEDVDDLVQEIMIEAYNHIGDLRDMDCLGSWLYKIASRKLIRLAGKRKTLLDNEELYSPEDWEIVDFTTEVNAKVFFIAHRRITDEELYEMIESLKPPAPEIINLRFVKGYTLKEISAMMGMNYNTVKTIEHRALEKLKKIILERGKYGDENEKELY